MSGIKRIIAGVSVAALGLLGLGAISPASALPYVGAHITLISPVLDATNTSEAAKNQALAETWVANKWFGDGLKFQRTFAPVGSRIILTYHVTDEQGAPLVGEKVILRMNKQYSESTALVTVDGTVAKPATSGADGARVTHITDSFGNVSFVVQDLDTDGEQQPAKITDAPIISLDGLDNTHAQFMPQVMNEPLDHSVITEFHFYKPTNPVAPSVTHPTIRLTTPALDDTNSVHRTDLESSLTGYAAGLKVRQAYVKVGTVNSVVYQVMDDAGKPAPGVTVTLHAGQAGSGSNASLQDITFGSSNAPTNIAAASGSDQATWTATSDAFGYVLFTMKNTDSKGETFPATLTTQPPATAAAGAKFSQFWISIAGGANDIGDLIQWHFVNPAVLSANPAPTITGTAKVGSTVSTTGGTWSAMPAPTLTYKWYRCASATTAAATLAAGKCTVIGGATKASYKVVAADKGKYVRVVVTGTNANGTGSTMSKSTGKVG